MRSRVIAILGGGLLSLAASARGAQRLAIPSYFYPGPLWTQMEDAAPQVGLAIINPDSGPGAASDPAYAAQVTSAQGAGIAVLGYVHTSYGARASAAVEAEIDSYYAWYPVDGIFLDEAATDCGTEPYYASLTAYVKSKGGAGTVALNPGTTTSECYMSAGDIIVTFESAYSDYLSWSPAGWESGYPADRFWHLIHGTSESHMPNAVILSQSRGVGWVYVTPDSLPNPWDTLPSGSYWTNELAYVQLTGCSPVVRPRIVIKGLGTPAGDDALLFSGEATLPGSPVLDPVAHGARVVIEDKAGAVLDVTLPAGPYANPPGSGWKTAGSGTKWSYSDRSAAPPGGITKVSIRGSASAPGVVTFSVKGRAGSYVTTSANLPLTGHVSFEPAATDGPCATASFPGPAPGCEINSAGSVATCR